MTDTELTFLERELAGGIEHYSPSVVGRLVTEVRRLRAAIQYAAGSFAQVPSTETVPPIVLHDCRRHLEEALS